MPRGPKRRRATFVLACLGVALLAPRARALAPTSRAPALHLEYTAPGNCPTQADFEAGVQARTTMARFADEPDAQDLHIVVRSTGTAYAGHLSIVSRSGHASERDVQGILCADVVDALALVTALAVDPHATLALPMSANPAPASPVAPPLGVSSTDTAAVTPSLSTPPAATKAPVAPPAPTPARASFHFHPISPTSATRWGAAVGAGFVTLAGIAPDALAGGGAFGEIESMSGEALAPSARLLFFAAENGAFTGRTASFTLLAARGDLCPVRIGSPDLSVRPCMGADGGALDAEGIHVTHPQRAVVGWLDLTLLVRARWVPRHGPFFVEVGGGILVPVTRPRFVYQESTGAFTQPAVDDPWDVGAIGSLDAGLRFW